MKTSPSWWISAVLLAVLATDRYDLNTLELLGLAVIYGFVTGVIDVILPDLFVMFRARRAERSHR